MTKFISISLIFFFLQHFSASAQLQLSMGSISGIVVDAGNKEPLVGATVLVQGTSRGAVTDINGRFEIGELQVNSYALQISYLSYKDSVFGDIKVEKNKKIDISIELSPNEKTIETVNISATKTTNTELSMIRAVKTNLNIANGISAQQILKSMDKDAGEIVKRIPGITIIDDRFIIVRGLSQRYNNVWLNNNPTPSSETDVRAFSFDNIPGSMIDNLLVFKAASPELPADFSGGFVKVFTKNMPDKNSFSVSLGTGFREGSTLNSFYTDKQGTTDFLGFDNGMRQLPKNFPSNVSDISLSNAPDASQQLTDLGQSLNKNWTVNQKQASPDLRVSISSARRFKIRNLQAGNITAVNYGNSYENNRILNSHFSVYNFADDKTNPAFEYNDNQNINSTKISVLNNFSLYLGNGNKLEFRNIFNQFGQNRTTIREGIDYYSYQNIKSYEFHYTQRSVYSGQLAGEHANGDDSKFDWSLGYSLAKRSEPDIRRLTMIQESDTESPHYGEYSLWFNPFADPVYAGRRYLNTNENVYSGTSNYKTNLTIVNLDLELKTGIYIDYKSRQFDARNLGYAMVNTGLFDSEIRYLPIEQAFSNENINATTGLKIDETTNKSDSYTATTQMNAGYFSVKIPIGNRININTGLRFEYNILEMNSYMTASSTKIHVATETPDIFPSVNATYNFNEKQLIRFAFGRSVNRPEFRELAPFFFVDFEHNAGIYGNPDLKDAYVNNFDLRYEIYPSASEMISFSVFYKDFTNPIETRFLESTPLQYSFQNADRAKSTGIEAELRKSLDFVPALKMLSLVFNASYIKSEVIFKDSQTDKNRPMQGQSPYIVNTGLYWQIEKTNSSLSLLYNIIGPRIVAVGQPMQNFSENIPEIYERQRNSIDFTVSQKIGKRFELKFGAKDILNQAIVYYQTIEFEKEGHSETRTQINKKYTPGRYYSLNITYNF